LRYSSDKDAESKGKLPNPQLNPMMNPTLGRNLGRWAQVYFTTPPEKREQAVVELLRELEGVSEDSPEERDQQESNQPIAESPQLKITEAPESTATRVAPLVCPDCHHNYLPGQWFCGRCGCSLQGHIAKAVSAPAAPTNGGRGTLNHDFPGSELLAESPAKVDQPDVQWLRERSLVNLAADTQKPRVFGKLAATVLVLLLVAFLYVQWRSQSPTGSPPHSISKSSAGAVPTPQRPAESASSGQVNKKAEGQQLSPEAHQKAQHSAAEANPPQQPTRGASPDEGVAATGKAAFPRDLRSAPVWNVIPSESGAADLAAAEKYLNAEGGSRDTAQAAKLLWKAIGKQNKAAILLLADLYERGDGIPKSCDQAEVLLVAAAKKGSTAAANRLRELQASGCK